MARDEDDYGEDDYEHDRIDYDAQFADPGGNSALRASTGSKCPHRSYGKKVGTKADFCKHCGQELNPRKYPCPNCGAKNRLTMADKRRGYQCDGCADRSTPRHHRA